MHWLNRILVAVLLAAAVAFLPSRLQRGAAADDLARVESERDELDVANAGLREQIGLVRAEVRALKRDRREVERIAREDLNLIRPGEYVYEVERPEQRGQSKRP